MAHKSIQEYFGLREELGRGGYGRVYATESPFRAAKVMKIKMLGYEGRNLETECTYLGKTGKFSQFAILRGKGDSTHAEIVDFFPSELIRMQMIAQEIGILQDAKDYSIHEGGRLVSYHSHRFFVDDEGWFSVLVEMDRVHGTTIDNLPPMFGKGKKVELCYELCDAVDQFHDMGYMHLDIKPSNVMVAREGAVLLDYTAAIPIQPTLIRDLDQLVLGEQNYIVQDGSFRGTVEFVAPEQARGKPTLQSDYYSLGLVVLELLDRYPFPRLTSREGKEVEQFLRTYCTNAEIEKKIMDTLVWSPFAQALPRDARGLFLKSISDLITFIPEHRKMDSFFKFAQEYRKVPHAAFTSTKHNTLPPCEMPAVPTMHLPELINA